MRTCSIQQGTLFNALWKPKQEGNPKKEGIYTHVCMLSHFSRVRLFVTLWTVAHQVPLSIGFSEQEY